MKFAIGQERSNMTLPTERATGEKIKPPLSTWREIKRRNSIEFARHLKIAPTIDPTIEWTRTRDQSSFVCCERLADIGNCALDVRRRKRLLRKLAKDFFILHPKRWITNNSIDNILKSISHFSRMRHRSMRLTPHRIESTIPVEPCLMRRIQNRQRVVNPLRKPHVQRKSIGEPSIGLMASRARNLAIYRQIFIKEKLVSEL